MAKVGIVMGSDSDMPVMSKAADMLEKFGIEYEMTIISAHREPDVFFEYAKTAEEKGFKVIIAGAGMAAHLPGMCAAIFPMPVIGIPMHTTSLGGRDSLYSIVQMPSGIPVATVAINGGANAAILAAKILATSDVELLQKLKERGEPTVLVLYGDHLPTMGLEAKDLKSRYLYNTNYVIWDNIGLQKEDRNIPSYQIMADVFDRLDIHAGTIFNYHQTRRQTKHYLSDLELLQYDILYGEQYVYGGKENNPIKEGHMQMGVLDVTLSELIAQMDGSYSLYGENFTKSSKVYVNGEKQKTTFLNNTRIDILDTEIKEGDTIEVSQVGSSNRIFRTSKQYIYQGGKLVEAPDTTVDQTEGTTTENTEQ